jgi:hypothetical protein
MPRRFTRSPRASMPLGTSYLTGGLVKGGH